MNGFTKTALTSGLLGTGFALFGAPAIGPATRYMAVADGVDADLPTQPRPRLCGFLCGFARSDSERHHLRPSPVGAPLLGGRPEIVEGDDVVAPEHARRAVA